MTRICILKADVGLWFQSFLELWHNGDTCQRNAQPHTVVER
jgi:hypothetical protein